VQRHDVCDGNFSATLLVEARHERDANLLNQVRLAGGQRYDLLDNAAIQLKDSTD
jgi:hypothetical protein